MNFQETIALIDALRQSGVTRFKSPEHEIDFDHKIVSKAKAPEAPKESDSKATVEATEKLKNLINTISMTPEELANTMFPDGAM